MPINIPDGLPAVDILSQENVFVMTDSRAVTQDIRPLKIAILNLMPTKETTEVQLIRLLGNTPIQVDLTLLHTESHDSKHTPREHLESFYKTFSDVRKQKFDGLVITGAPVEQIEFEEVNYWEELKQIMEWQVTNVTSTLYICWGAQAGLYYHYGIPKYPLQAKMFGIFPHTTRQNIVNTQLIRGFDDEFFVPHSRHTEVKREDIEKVEALEIVAESEESGVYIVASKDKKQIFVTGHSEYDLLTLKKEYDRDVSRALPIEVPKNYFLDNDPSKMPRQRWRSHANLLFSNWLNYYVYQETPFNLAGR